MATCDVLLRWSGANSLSQHTSRGGPVSTAQVPDYSRYSVSFDTADVLPVTGTYPIPGFAFKAVDYSSNKPWELVPYLPNPRIIVNVTAVNPVARTITVSFTVESYMTGNLGTLSNHSMTFTESQWGQANECYLNVGWANELFFTVTPSLVTTGSRTFRVFPTVNHPSSVPLLHTGSFVSPQVVRAIRLMESSIGLWPYVHPVYMQGFDEVIGNEPGDNAFGIQISHTWSSSTIGVTLSSMSPSPALEVFTGVQYRKFYVASMQGWVVLRVDTDWFGTVSEIHRINISGFLNVNCVGRENGFFLPEVLRGGAAAHNLQRSVALYLHNISSSAHEIRFRASPVDISPGYSIAVKPDSTITTLDEGWFLDTPDGITPSLAVPHSGWNSWIGSSFTSSLGTINAGMLGGFWLTQASTTSSPATEDWVPITLDIAAV